MFYYKVGERGLCMPNGMLNTINKLQKAINSRDGRVIIDHTQFYSEQMKAAIPKYTIKQAYWNEDKSRTESYEIYSSYSQLQTVLFLRDYWYKMNNWEIPTDNEQWNGMKANYYNKHPNIAEEDRV